MPENLLPIITLNDAPPPFFFSSFFPFEFVIGEFEVKRACIAGQTLVFLLILWCTYTVYLMNYKIKVKWKIVILQTFKCTCWQRIRQQNINKGIYFSKYHTLKQVLWTSIPKDMTGIHTLNPNIFYCVHFSIFQPRCNWL